MPILDRLRVALPGDLLIEGIATSAAKSLSNEVKEPLGMAAWGIVPIHYRHDLSTKAIGYCDSFNFDGSAVRFRARIPDSADPMAKAVRAGILDGSLAAVSVGPGGSAETQRDGAGVLHVKRWTLIEISVVTKGANPDARITAARLEPSISYLEVNRDLAAAEARTTELDHDAAEYVRANVVALKDMRARLLAGLPALGGCQPGKQHLRGAAVLHDGAAWRAQKDTFDTPGRWDGWVVWGGIPLSTVRVRERPAWSRPGVRTVASLRKRVAELEGRALVEDRGVWQVDRDYTPGALVSFQGSAWICQAGNRGIRPGTSAEWRLAVKKEKAK